MPGIAPIGNFSSTREFRDVAKAFTRGKAERLQNMDMFFAQLEQNKEFNRLGRADAAKLGQKQQSQQQTMNWIAGLALLDSLTSPGDDGDLGLVGRGVGSGIDYLGEFLFKGDDDLNFFDNLGELFDFDLDFLDFGD